MENEIYTISIENEWLDYDYTFYEDGRIKRFYDDNSFSYNNTDWISAGNISDNKKNRK